MSVALMALLRVETTVELTAVSLVGRMADPKDETRVAMKDAKKAESMVVMTAALLAAKRVVRTAV